MLAVKVNTTELRYLKYFTKEVDNVVFSYLVRRADREEVAAEGWLAVEPLGVALARLWTRPQPVQNQRPPEWHLLHSRYH